MERNNQKRYTKPRTRALTSGRSTRRTEDYTHPGFRQVGHQLEHLHSAVGAVQPVLGDEVEVHKKRLKAKHVKSNVWKMDEAQIIALKRNQQVSGDILKAHPGFRQVEHQLEHLIDAIGAVQLVLGGEVGEGARVVQQTHAVASRVRRRAGVAAYSKCTYSKGWEPDA